MSGLRVTWAAVASLALVAHAPAAEPAAPAPAEPRFHRVYVPADQIQKGAWSKGYLPIDATEFSDLIETVHAGAIGAPGAGAAEIEQAEYTAELVGPDLLVGSANLQLARRAREPGMLSLDPCSVAVGAADWQDQNAKAAVLGSGPQGGAQVLVEGNRLHFAWSLRAERTALGAIGFRIELPAAPIARLAIDAPASLELIADHGIVGKTAGVAPNTTRWTFELGPTSRLTLRIATEGLARERRPFTFLRQALTYELSSRGVNVAAQLKLDIHGEPLQRIAVDLDQGLRLVAVRYGELQVPFSVTEDVESRLSHVVLQMPEPIGGTGRVLQLSAIAPLVIGKRWQLPGLRPEAMSWQEGTATLLIPAGLVLDQLTTDGCRQSRTAALPAPASGDSLEIQYFRPSATIDVLLAQPREQLKVDSGSTVDVGLNEVTSRVLVELRLARAERRAVQFPLRAGWTVDAVEDVAANRALEWELEESSGTATQLNIRLDDPISAERPARLMIRGHRAPPEGAAFEGRELDLLDFDGFRGDARLISVRGAEGVELRWTAAADLNRLDPLKMSPGELSLFPQAPTGFLFAANAAFAQSTIALERRSASYSADIRIDAALQEDELTETYTIQCLPETSRVDRLLVRLSQARETPLAWNLAGGNSGQFSARKISAAEQAQLGLPEGGEAWDLSLHLARPGPFELRGVRTTELEEPTPLALASVAQATVQRGALTIRALGAAGVGIKNRRLSSIPAELLESGRYQTARATYEYQPGRDDMGAEPAVSVAPAAGVQTETGAWVWTSRLDSRYSAAGTAVHWATLRIQTAGTQQVRVTLPADAQLQAAWVDDQRLPLVVAASEKPGFLVDLPSGRSFATLALYYSTSEKMPALTASVEPAFPQLDIPVMGRQWTVWLPQDYEIREAPGRFSIDSMIPLTWTQRLFGGLGRGATSTVFNPLIRHDWRQLVSPEGDTAAGRAASAEFAETLGTLMAEYLSGEAESELTWGQLLALCSDEQALSRRVLLVDGESLAALRLNPKTRVRYQPGDSARERGVALLSQAGLAVIAKADVLAVTSAATVGLEGRQVAHADRHVLFAISPGPLSHELEGAAQSGAAQRFQSIAAWRTAPQRGPSPWTHAEATNVNPQQALAWNAYTLHLSQADVPRVRIVRTAAIGSLAWAIFLAVVGIGLWQGSRRRTELVVFGSLAAALALLVPAAYAPLASGAFLGALLCLIVQMTRLPKLIARRQREKSPSTRTQFAVAHHGAVLLLTATILNLSANLLAWQPPAARTPAATAAANPGSADAPAANTSEPAAPIHRVVVPVDDQQRLSGGKYYISEDFFSQLYREAAAAHGRPKGWLITRALYQGKLTRDNASKQLGLTELKATFELRVLGTNTPIQLPFPREGSTNPLVAARVDGRPVRVEWTAGGDGLVIPPLPLGSCRVELDLRASSQTSGTSAGFDLPIPPLPGAVLELTVPADAPTVEVPAARGQVRLQKDRGLVLAQLGACNRLSVRWPVGIGMETSTANLEVEELIWVKVRPGTTVFDARFKYRVVEGGVRQIRLLTDPRLRLLPSTNPQSPIAHTIPGDPQRIDLELPRTVTDQVVVDLSFLLTGTSGVGNLQFPRLESSAARATRRWLAASVDPALESKEFPGEDSKPLAIADFMAAWGTADSRPQAVYSIPRGEAMWVLATQPSAPRTMVEQVSAVSLGRLGALVEFDAALSITGGYLFQLGLAAPANLAIEQVSVVEDDVERVVRWSMDEAGRTTVFLSGPITGRQRLTLRGRVASAGTSVAILPQLTFSDADIKRNLFHVYRQSDVLVEVDAKAGVNAVKSEDVKANDELGALVGSYEIDSPRTAFGVKLSPNVPQSKAVMVTALERDGDRWTAQMACRVKVLEGVVDALAFDVPPQWAEPFRIDPPARAKVVPVPGETRRQLIIYPDRPIHDTYELKVHGRVALSAGDRLRVPDIVPERIQQVDRFVALPQHLDLQQMIWETIGLARATLPAEFATQIPGVSSTTVYQVEADHFQASLKAVQRAATTARVKLADIHVMWQPNGHCQGVATFDLEPAGATSCVLQLPANCQLLHASIESLPAQLAAAGENQWRLSLGPPELPQRLEVVFTGVLGESAGRSRLVAPRLVDLEVNETLWTVYCPQFATADLDNGQLTVSAAQQELERLKSLASLAQLPAEIVGEHLPEEIARWYRPWKQRYSASRDVLAGALVATGPLAAQSAEAVEAAVLDAKIGAVDARLGTTPAARQNLRSDAAAELLPTLASGARAARYIARGPLYDIEIVDPQSARTSRVGRIILGLGFVMLAVAGAFVLRNRELPKFAPWLVITVVAIAWWLFLVPSVVGLAALGVAAWVAIRDLGQANHRSAET